MPTKVAVAVVCVVLATGCADRPTTREQAPEAPSAVPGKPTTSAPGEVEPARRARSVVAAAAPTRVDLPSGRSVAVAAVGTTPAGRLEVPTDIDVAGWWRGGSRLGDPFGSILVAAHVDSRTQGLGPFAELLSLDAGATVRLASPHLLQDFEVRSRRLVPQGSLVDDSWIFSASGAHRLTLVTCAPPYDPARGGYQNLAVVTAVAIGEPVSP